MYTIHLGGILDLTPQQNQNHKKDEIDAKTFFSTPEEYNYYNDTKKFQGDKFIPENILKIYQNYRITAIERNKRMTLMFREQSKQYFDFRKTNLALEIGCGHGGNLLTLAKLYRYVIGVDPNLSALASAKRLLEDQGVSNVILIRCYAQNIPYPNSSFDYVTAINVIEHVLDVDSVIKEINRVLCCQGVFVADSRNRYDLFFPEPHVQIRFVGFLPRQWAKKYVFWRRRMEYNDTYLLSYFDLKKVLKKYFNNSYKILCVKVKAYGYNETIDRLIDKLHKIPLLSKIILFIFPSFLVVAQKSCIE